MKRRSFFLTEKQIEQLEHTSKASGLTLAEVLRRIIDSHFRYDQRSSPTSARAAPTAA